MTQVTPLLYIKPGCPWCEEAIEFLDSRGIGYKKIVVSGNPDAMQELIDLSGQSKTPTMNWDGKVLADFGVDELVPFLKNLGVLNND